jgi:hypothetical protein
MARNLERLISLLPEDVIINHIIPFTYLVQPRKLLVDIRSYVIDYSFLENIYTFEYNDEILLYDLVTFCNNGKFPTWGLEPKYDDIIRRHFIYKSIRDSDLQLLIFMAFHRKMGQLCERKNRFLWGLLRPRERTSFINKYLGSFN